MDFQNLFGGLLGNAFGGGQTAGQPMDIRPQGLQQTMDDQQGQQDGGFGGYNIAGDIGLRLLAAGQPMTADQRGQIVNSIPGAVTSGIHQDNRNKALLKYIQSRSQGQQPVGLLGNAAQTAQGNNNVWANLGRGMNADGSANMNAGFGGVGVQNYAQPVSGNNGYGLY